VGENTILDFGFGVVGRA